MILPENPTADELNAALDLIRVKVRAGLIDHPDWPPPETMPVENRLLLLDRIAKDVLRSMREPRI